MGLGPRLPDNAPFSSSQRAWLNGYFAGLFSLEAGGDDRPQLSPPAAAPVVPMENEELPWHDPILSLDDRMALAQGKRSEHVLMAAMAQTDCGQCGYLCQTYAQAIARGEEKSLSRCVPGGKATSRKLKELVAMFGVGDGAVAVPAMVLVPAPKPIEAGSPDKLLDAWFCEARPLNHPESEKDTRHVVLTIDPAHTGYEVGDSHLPSSTLASPLGCLSTTCSAANWIWRCA
jgi:sulfite reductase (NADPH) flavoprotein alpha-component